MTRANDWWKNAVVYQLLVPSFADSDGDGYGDLAGVIERLDYLEWLGIDALWLSPIYRSPFRELGYDVADYYDVDPRFGTLETFDTLVAEAHRRGLRILLDWVPNHTSDQHAWFLESASGRGSPKRDWYIWRDPNAEGQPPNNWISVFGGSVWEWHEPSGQYYLHTFLARQPDLNWRNGDVREAMCDTLKFWLERGVDGFRVDATCLLIKDEGFRDNPPNPDYRPGRDGPDNSLLPTYTRDQPGLHDVLALIRRTVDAHGGPDKALLGEIYLSIEQLVRFYGSPAQPELHLPLCMLLAWTSWDAPTLGRTIATYQRSVPQHGWPASMLSTHDQCRVAMRTDGEQRRVAAMLLATLRGTLSHYYGEEIGMRGVHIPPERAIDPQGRLTGRNRDPERTPMQWSAGPNAGFSKGAPWLPVGADYKTVNVASQRDDPRSILSLYRRLFRLRRERPVLVSGRHVPVVRDAPVLAYRREDERDAVFVALNLGPEPVRCDLDAKGGEILLSTELDREGERCASAVDLRGDEGVIVLERR